MKGIFDFDNPFMSFLGKIADLMILNILTLICCIPIVTIGAAFTAMYYVLLRISKDEPYIVTKDFFRSFKVNFRQATVLWVIYLQAIIVIAVEYYLMFAVGLKTFLNWKYVIYLLTALVLIGLIWSFVLLSRYDNRIVQTLVASFYLGFKHIIRTIAMVILMAAPFVLLLIFPAAVSVVLVIGFSLPGYLQAFLFSKVFEQLERNQENKKDQEIEPV